MIGLRTKDGLSESVTAEQVLSSIIMFGVIYSFLFVIWIFVLNKKIQHGPESADELNAYLEKLAAERAGSSGGEISELFEQSSTVRGGGMMKDRE